MRRNGLTTNLLRSKLDLSLPPVTLGYLETLEIPLARMIGLLLKPRSLEVPLIRK